MHFDVLIRVGISVPLTVGAYVLTRYLLARFALPVLRRHRPPRRRLSKTAGRLQGKPTRAAAFAGQ